MEMPIVNKCDATSCAYNQDENCHALAITIGDPHHAQCDTFLNASMRGGSQTNIGHVGACKVAKCQHNVDLECQAPGISVGQRSSTVDCLTYAPA